MVHGVDDDYIWHQFTSCDIGVTELARRSAIFSETSTSLLRPLIETYVIALPRLCSKKTLF